MTITVLDLENWSARGATAELTRKTLTVRLSFRLVGAPSIVSLASVGRGAKCNMVPNLLIVEYTKMSNSSDDGEWKITVLRVYGNKEGSNETALNVYPHDNMGNSVIPAWIRDAAFDGVPK